jgi:hypothetical protein
MKERKRKGRREGRKEEKQKKKQTETDSEQGEQLQANKDKQTACLHLTTVKR